MTVLLLYFYGVLGDKDPLAHILDSHNFDPATSSQPLGAHTP
jgi:hypothetical protein